MLRMPFWQFSCCLGINTQITRTLWIEHHFVLFYAIRHRSVFTRKFFICDVRKIFTIVGHTDLY